MTFRILAPVDTTGFGEAKYPVCEQYARAFDADVLLLHVLGTNAINPDVVLPTEASARAYLDTVVARFRAAGVRAESVVYTGQPAETIVNVAVTQRVDLILIGSSTRPVLPRVLIGSVADQVVREAPCPVLLIRPTPAATSATELRNFQDEADRAGPLIQRSLGLRTIEIGRIVGSVGRSQDLGSAFRPTRRRKLDDQRYLRILHAMQRGDVLPPVELYKLGFGYYVLDGHHRVAAARSLGQLEIEANVTEFLPARDQQAARAFAERRSFERATGLKSVGATRPESYGSIGASIEELREEQDVGDFRDAAGRWYGAVYHPLWQRIRRDRLASQFPGERTADLVARVVDFREEVRAESGTTLGWDEAYDAFRAEVQRRRDDLLDGA